jgi:hypothetical protein
VKKAEWITVTPAIAEEWLTRNTTNRKLREGVVEKYARDMLEGRWSRNPQPIIWYDDTKLADGQHRLWAVVISGVTVEFFVHWDVDREAGLNIDTGVGRDLVDNARISGYEGYLTKQSVGTALVVAFGRVVREKTLSGSERMALVEKYASHLQFADSQAPVKRGVAPREVRAAIARAHMHLGDNARLVEFCKILGTGIPNEVVADRAALAFRNYMLEVTAGRKLDPRDTFLKAMNAIDYFVRRKALTVIKVVKEEAFPLKGAEPKVPSLPKRKLAELEKIEAIPRASA